MRVSGDLDRCSGILRVSTDVCVSDEGQVDGAVSEVISERLQNERMGIFVKPLVYFDFSQHELPVDVEDATILGIGVGQLHETEDVPVRRLFEYDLGGRSLSNRCPVSRFL